MSTSDIVMLGIAGLLTVYLAFRHWQRELQRPPDPSWEGHGMDVSDVAAKVERVRADFAAALQSQPQDSCQRQALLASARKVVGCSSYFRSRLGQGLDHADHDTETHAT